MDTVEMLWLFIGLISIQSAVSIDAGEMTLNQLENMVADLKISHELLSQKISEIQFENNYFKASMKKLKVQKMNDWKGECTTCKTKIEHKRKSTVNSKSNEFEEFIKTKSRFLQTDESTVLDTDGQPKDDFESVKSIGTNSYNPRIKERGTAPNIFGKASLKRLLLSANLLSFSVSYFENIHYWYTTDVGFS